VTERRRIQLHSFLDVTYLKYDTGWPTEEYIACFAPGINFSRAIFIATSNFRQHINVNKVRKNPIIKLNLFIIIA